MFVIAAMVCELLAIIFGFIGKKAAKGMSIAGIIIGIIMFIISIIVFAGFKLIMSAKDCVDNGNDTATCKLLDNDVESFNSKIKKFYFEKKNALKFLKIIKKLLNIYKIKITYNDKIFGNINFNEIDEVKEEKINEKQINEETKNENKEDKDEEKNINNEKIEKEEEKDKNKEEEKDKNKEEKNENKEEEKEEIKEGDEIFTTENVVEKHAEKQNKNLIDI